jgi:hypothetical protein
VGRSKINRDNFRQLKGIDTLLSCLEISGENVHILWGEMSKCFNTVLLDSKENTRYFQSILSNFNLLSKFKNIDQFEDLKVVLNGFLNICFEEDVSFESGIFKAKNLNLDNVLLFPIMFEFIRSVSKKYPELGENALELIYKSIKENQFNAVLVASTGCLQNILLWVVDENEFKDINFKLDTTKSTADLSQNNQMKIIAMFLMLISKEITALGISSDSLRICISKILTDHKLETSKKLFLFDLMLNTLQIDRKNPGYFRFDPKFSPSRILLDDFGKLFPPQTGFSILGWIKIEKFDPKNDIPVITIQDPTGHSVFKIFICKTKKSFTIQTLKGNIIIEQQLNENQWVHFVFTHQRPMMNAASMNFFINGFLISSQKFPYVASPGALNPIKTYLGSDTIMDSLSRYVYLMGPIYMIEEYVMDPQTAEIIFDIGFEYFGNWQGNLQTYLVGNKELQRKTNKFIQDETNSPILNQLASFAVSPAKQYQNLLSVPEESILFSISSRNEFRNLSIHTQRELLDIPGISQMIKIFDQNIILNGSHIRIYESGDSRSKLCKIEGKILPVKPVRFVDAIWTLGGCAIYLRMIEEATNSEEFHRTLSILVQSVTNDWRSLAELERGQMYEILSYILKSKSSFITIANLDVIFSLVGKIIGNSE